jgi:hypothetical protein
MLIYIIKYNLPSSNTNIAINKKARIGINYTIYLNPKPCELIMSINWPYSIKPFHSITRTLTMSLSSLCSNTNWIELSIYFCNLILGYKAFCCYLSNCISVVNPIPSWLSTLKMLKNNIISGLTSNFLISFSIVLEEESMFQSKTFKCSKCKASEP